MSFHWHPAEQVRIGRYLFKWTLLASLVGIGGGTASAIFLHSLAYATDVRVAHPWLLYFLPVGGVAIALLYHWWGKDCERGNNLILEEIHNPRAGVSGRMAPLILLSTVATHLFGGSAGREGTAVQMGGSLAGWLARKIGLDRFHTRLMLMAGISAGVGSIFGTPLAGMIFGLEVLAVGRLRYDALIPCLVASVVGNWTCVAWGVQRTDYRILMVSAPDVDALLVAKVLLASLAFALTSVFFAETTHLLRWLANRWIAWAPARPFVGGVIVILLVWILRTDEYLGLGLPSILESFTREGVPTWAFLWKVLFTAVTLGAGFKGGEVTPLFFIGAALGSTLGTLLGVPHDFMAALGFVAVFAGAANTPLACSVMGLELFGVQHGVFLGIACCSAYIWTGHRGIYLSQLIATPKTDDHHLADETSLSEFREKQPRHEAARQPRIESVGLLRIYVARHKRKPGMTWLQKRFSRPLHAEIIDLAQSAGLSAQTAESLPDRPLAAGSGLGGSDNRSHVCVELMGPCAKLEEFQRQISPWMDEG
jgi:H+/Cl- antiporter ClcA